MSGYSWTLPTPAPTAANVAEEQKELLLGKDLYFDGDYAVNRAGDYVVVTGLTAMRQAIYTRLITRPGEYRTRPDYGVGVLSYVKKRLISTELELLEGRIIDQLSLDDRIEQVREVKVERLTGTLGGGGEGVRIGIAVQVAGETLRFKPFDFTPETLIGTVI